MSGLFQNINIARSGLSASRTGLNVASHNIANANTPGYSRQRVDFTTALPLDTISGMLGMGVDSESVRRIRNGLLDRQYYQANHTFGKNDIKEKMLSQVDNILQEPSENGIGNLMTEFFNEFSNLGGEPDSTNIRNLIVQKSTRLVDAFHSKSGRLRDVQKSLRADVSSTVGQINELSRQVAELNRQISISENSFSTANDLRDQRDLVMDKLSEYVQIDFNEDSRGKLSVSIDGQMLVSGIAHRELSVGASSDSNELTVYVEGSAGSRLNIQSGKLGGLLDMHNKQVGGLMDRLNQLAKSFVDEINRIHQFGKGLPVGNPPTSASGIKFFTGSDAASINIASEIEDNVANIAASLDGTPGNGDSAFTIANLRDQKFFSGGTSTFNEYYNDTITSVGTEIQVTSTDRRNQQLLLDQIDNQRAAESGVSLDEEMTDLIKYQRSLEASARVISAVDELLQTIINL